MPLLGPIFISSHGFTNVSEWRNNSVIVKLYVIIDDTWKTIKFVFL